MTLIKLNLEYKAPKCNIENLKKKVLAFYWVGSRRPRLQKAKNAKGQKPVKAKMEKAKNSRRPKKLKAKMGLEMFSNFIKYFK